MVCKENFFLVLIMKFNLTQAKYDLPSSTFHSVYLTKVLEEFIISYIVYKYSMILIIIAAVVIIYYFG